MANALGARYDVQEQFDAADAGLPAVLLEADADRLRQALMIVLDNAVRYSRHGGTVWVSRQRPSYPPSPAAFPKAAGLFLFRPALLVPGPYRF